MIGSAILHYRIVRALGSGAAGVTYLAQDVRLGRPVVLKFLARSGLDDSTCCAELEREARSLARLRHPHIARLHTLEVADGRPFLVMPYVEGATLRGALSFGPMPAEAVIRLGLALAGALAHAHRHGVLHRDVKPENILVDERGHVRLADFGIAALLEHGGPPEGEISGTTHYMSPEQARGAPAGVRSDLYSVGAVLFEALTGRPPAAGDDRSPSAIRPGVPAALDALVVSCLAPQPEDRPASAAALEAGLLALPGARAEARPRVHRTVLVAVLGTVMAVALIAGLRRTATPASQPGTVMVAPFESHPDDGAAGYVGEAFARSLAANLAHSEPLRLLQPALEVPRRLPAQLGEARRRGAQWLVTGGIERDGPRLLAHTRLLETTSGRELWHRENTIRDRDLPVLAHEISDGLTAELRAVTPPAYDYFFFSVASETLASSPLLGRVLSEIRSYDREGTERDTEALLRAFPDEPEARLLYSYALLGKSWTSGTRSPDRQAFDASLDAVREVDARNPWPDVLAGLMASRDGQLDQAVETFTRVLARHDLTPAARAHILSLRGQSLRDLGDGAGAIEDLELAQRLHAVNMITLAILSDALGTFGRREEALTRARQALSLAPDVAATHTVLAQAYGRLGRWREAVAPAAEATRIEPSHTTIAFQALALEHAGKPAPAARLAERLRTVEISDWGLELEARFEAQRGHFDRACALLDRSMTMGFKDPELRTLPEFAPIAGEERFRRLLARLPPAVPPPPAAGIARR